MHFQRQLPAVVSSPRLKQGLGSSSCLVLVLILEAGWEGGVEVAPLSSQDKGGDGLKELDSLKSDRLRTIQLNICKSEEVEEAVEIVRSSLEDPEKGKRYLGQVHNAQAIPRVPFLNATLHIIQVLPPAQ